MEMNFSKLLRMRADQLESSIAHVKADKEAILKPNTVKAFVAANIYREIADMFDAAIAECDGSMDVNKILGLLPKDDSIPRGIGFENMTSTGCSGRRHPSDAPG